MGNRPNSAVSAAISLISIFLFIHGAAAGVDKASYDYYVWATSILALYALYRELKAYAAAPVASTMLVGVAGGALTAFGRLASLLINLFGVFGYVAPLVGSEYYSPASLYATTLVPIGALYIFISAAINAANGGPVPLGRSSTYREIYRALASWAKRVDVRLKGTKAGTATAASISFAIAFAYRFRPELFYSGFLIGWDTVEYAAHLMDFMSRWQIFAPYYWMGDYRHIPPMLDIILSPFASAFGAWAVFKVYPTVAFATIAALSALITMKVFRKDWKVGLLAGLMSTLYILNLRISWDYQRQLLGTVFLLLSIFALDLWGLANNLKRAAAAAALLVATALSHEAAGLAAMGVALTLAYMGLKRGDKYSLVAGAVALAADTALEAWYWGKPIEYVSSTGLAYLPGFVPSGGQQGYVVSYLIAGFGLVLFPAIAAAFRHKKIYIAAATATLVLAGISPLIAPDTSVTLWYRFLIGAAPLMTILAAVGITDATKDWRAIAAYLIAFALPGFMFVYAYNWLTNYISALSEFPNILMPSPPSINYIRIYQFFETHHLNYTIVAGPDIARYIHLAIRNPNPQKFQWAWYVDTWDYACQVAQEHNLTELVVVANSEPNRTQCPLNATPINDYEPHIYLVHIEPTHTASP
ncbi:MAG: hypothetical protein QXP98_03885 [Thermoproteus sp.]